jgi:hypothetical protein
MLVWFQNQLPHSKQVLKSYIKSKNEVVATLKYLSSDELEGREWYKGMEKAADYLEQFFK